MGVLMEPYLMPESAGLSMDAPLASSVMQLSFLCSVLAVGAARGGAQSMKPLLQNLYRTRASAYQRAVRSFVEGYREGLSEPPKDSSGPEAPLAAHAPKRPQARSESGRPE